MDINALDDPASNTEFLMSRDVCFFNLGELAYLKQNDCFPTLKTMIFRKQSFQKLTRFSMCNTVLHVPASNTDGFLRQIHVFLQLT
jgi:hypothetical protein